MVRRLAGRARQTPPQSLRLAAQRHSLHAPDAGAGGRKKSPCLGSIGQLATAWAQAKYRHSSDARIARHIAAAWRTLNPHQLTAHLINAQVLTWRNANTQATVHNYTGALKRFLKFIDRSFGTHHADDCPRARRGQPRTTVVTDADFNKMLSTAKPWFKFFLRICRELGLRNGEARDLTPHNFIEDTDTLTFDRKMEGHSNLPVPPELAKTIRYARDLAPDQPIIITLGARSKSAATITREWCKTRKRAGLSDNLTPHDLRRTVAKRLYDHTRDLRLVQQLMGHRSLSSTLNYIGLADPVALRQALRDTAPQRTLEDMQPATERTQ